MVDKLLPEDARKAIERARRVSQESGLPGGKSDGPADALRHISAAIDLTLKYGHLPVRLATLVGERISANYTIERFKMDVHNNYLGMNLALKHGNYEDALKDAADIIGRGRFVEGGDRSKAIGLGADSDRRASWFSSSTERFPTGWEQNAFKAADTRALIEDAKAQSDAAKEAAEMRQKAEAIKEAAEQKQAAREAQERRKAEERKRADKQKALDSAKDDKDEDKPPPVEVHRDKLSPYADPGSLPSPWLPYVHQAPTNDVQFRDLLRSTGKDSETIEVILELDKNVSRHDIVAELQGSLNATVIKTAQGLSAALLNSSLASSQSLQEKISIQAKRLDSARLTGNAFNRAKLRGTAKREK